MNNKVLAFIPARANSKGVKDKNIKKLNGKPLVSLTIDFAKELKFIDYIVVCSDSLKIKRIAKDKKINFILRPEKLSTDDSKVESSLIYTLQNFKEAHLIEYILLLEPTSPFRQKNTVKKCNKKKKILDETSFAYEINEIESIDINTINDFKIAELLCKK